MDRMKVFISSTQRDLQKERDGVETIIGRLGHECIRSETFDSPGFSPESVCLKMARDCDIYIGLFGDRYGFEPENYDISVTALEYREARADNPLKIFIYVKDVKKIEPKQEHFLQEIQDFSNGYFRHEKFKELDQLTEQVERDIITWTTRQIRRALSKEIEVRALIDKVEHLSRIMEMYGVPENLR